jgi:hypothetical protein
MHAQAESAGMLNFYACKGAHTLFAGQRERERESEAEFLCLQGCALPLRQPEREGGGRKRERDVLNMVIFIFGRNDGCLGTF